MKNILTGGEGEKKKVGINTSHKHTWVSMCQAAMKTHFFCTGMCTCTRTNTHTHAHTLLYGALKQTHTPIAVRQMRSYI